MSEIDAAEILFTSKFCINFNAVNVAESPVYHVKNANFINYTADESNYIDFFKIEDTIFPESVHSRTCKNFRINIYQNISFGDDSITSKIYGNKNSNIIYREDSEKRIEIGMFDNISNVESSIFRKFYINQKFYSNMLSREKYIGGDKELVSVKTDVGIDYFDMLDYEDIAFTRVNKNISRISYPRVSVTASGVRRRLR